MISLALVSIILFNMSCTKTANNGVQSPSTTTYASIININLVGLQVDSGFSYRIGYTLPQSGDSNASPRSSTLQIFENGIALGPAHAEQNDIRKYGLGQYTHWGTTLYFSTSDNSNPLTNGRKYTYKMN